MQLSTKDKVFAFIQKEQLLMPQDSVVVGVSGGADSVCLLFLLCEYRKEFGLNICAVHVNHGIREEAKADAAFVSALCEKLGVAFHLVEQNIPEIAKRDGISEEEAGRVVRYRAFENIAAQIGQHSKIAVAHHKGDQAETVLFHMFRGSSLHGLSGMAAKRDNLIRPLLCLSRTEIENYLLSLQEEWVTDATNTDENYSRNRIRHTILPAAEMISCGATEHICRLAAEIAEMDSYLASQTKKAYERCVHDAGAGKEIACSAIGKEESVIQKRLLLQVLTDIAGSSKDFGAVHVQQLLELCRRAGNRYVYFPYKICAKRSYDTVLVNQVEDDFAQKEALFSEVPVDECKLTGGIQVGAYWLQLFEKEDFSDERWQQICSPQPTSYTKWLDYDKIGTPLVLRNRKQGDYLVLDGAGNQFIHKSLKDFMINAKIPAEQRDFVDCFAVGSRCIYLSEYRIGADCKVTENTKRVLQIKSIKG